MEQKSKIEYLKWIIFLIVISYFLVSYFNMINEVELLIVLRLKDIEKKRD
jgi:hypothetical protein